MSSLKVERLKCKKSDSERFVNGFLLSVKDTCVLVDCGFGEHFDFIKEKIGSKKLEYIIITHCHLDHCGSVAELQKHFNSKIVLTSYENDRMKKGENSDLIPRTKQAEEFVKTLKGGQVYGPCSGDILIKNDSSFVVSEGKEDFQLKIILTPGHTPGSLSVISQSTKECFVGDLLYPGDFKSFGKPLFFNSEEDFKKSMLKLLQNEQHIQKIWTGHNDQSLPFNDLLQFCKSNKYV